MPIDPESLDGLDFIELLESLIQKGLISAWVLENRPDKEDSTNFGRRFLSLTVYSPKGDAACDIGDLYSNASGCVVSTLEGLWDSLEDELTSGTLWIRSLGKH